MMDGKNIPPIVIPITKTSQLWRTIYISIFERGSRERYPVYKESYIGEDTRINLVLACHLEPPPLPPT
jgi:hypothetical protein